MSRALLTSRDAVLAAIREFGKWALTLSREARLLRPSRAARQAKRCRPEGPALDWTRVKPRIALVEVGGLIDVVDYVAHVRPDRFLHTCGATCVCANRVLLARLPPAGRGSRLAVRRA